MHKNLVRKPEEKEKLESPRRLWNDNIKMDLINIDGRIKLHSSVSGKGTVAGCCDHANKYTCSIKYEECFD
jgi:hypothetical protein